MLYTLSCDFTSSTTILIKLLQFVPPHLVRKLLQSSSNPPSKSRDHEIIHLFFSEGFIGVFLCFRGQSLNICLFRPAFHLTDTLTSTVILPFLILLVLS